MKHSNPKAIKQILVFRLSSLGDILLSLAFIESLPASIEVDWVTSQEFSFLLKDHPRIRKLYLLDKKKKLKGWFELLKETLLVPYDLRVDLHVTLRSKLARVYFLLKDCSRGKFTSWESISKQRVRFFTYLIFKSLTPKKIRPTPFWERFATLGVQLSTQEFTQESKNALSSKLKPPSYAFAVQKNIDLAQVQLEERSYWCIMPASRWSSKEWGIENYIELLTWMTKNSNFKIVLLGRSSDVACAALSEKLTKQNVPFVSLLDQPDFSVTATYLSKAYAYLGSDTGLAHLAEAVGTPAWVIFGPTRPDLGFGPRREDSVAITAALTNEVFCSPCSKDGRRCYRFWAPYECLKRVTVDGVIDCVVDQTAAQVKHQIIQAQSKKEGNA